MDTFYLEITSALSNAFKNNNQKFKKLAQAATDYHEMDNGNCCFLWENVSHDQVDALKDVLYSCNDDHYHVLYGDVKRSFALHYGNLYNENGGISVSIKLSIKKG